MQSLVGIINNIISEVAVKGDDVLHINEMPEDMTDVLQNGARANLKVAVKEAMLITQLEIDNQVYDVKLSGNIPHPTNDEVLNLPVKVASGNRLQIMPDTLAQQFKSVDVPSAVKVEINSAEQLKSVLVEPLKLDEFINSKLDEFNVSSSVKEQIMPQIPRLQISLSAIGLKPDNANDLLQPLYNTLKQIAKADNQELNFLQNQLRQNIVDLIGKNISGEVIRQNNNVTFVKTDLGESFFDAPLKIHPHEDLTFNVSNIISPDKTFQNSPLEQILRLFGNDIVDKPDFNTKSLSEIFSTISNRNNTLSNNTSLLNLLAEKLPTYNQNFLSNMVNFYRAAVQKDVSIWLGDNNIKNITAVSTEVQSSEIIADLNRFVASSIKDTPLWKVVEIPVYAENNFKPLKIALKKNGENQSEHEKTKQGTRFIVETQFSKMGEFQFDGFVRAKDRTLDLIIRTSSPVEDDFCSQVINLFKNSLYSLDYKGNIKINQKDAFINFYENTPQKQGIYI